METGESLLAPESVRRLQTALHAKAKGDPDFRFYTLSDKVWCEDVYRGTRLSRESVRSLYRKISEATEARYGLLEPELEVERLNRAMLGWTNYFQLGQVSPAYRAVDRHAVKRLRQWLCRKHRVRSGKYVRFPDTWLWNEFGLARLAPRTASFPRAKARSRPRAGCRESARPVQRVGRRTAAMRETEAPAARESGRQTATPSR